jgi:hypothetical protein
MVEAEEEPSMDMLSIGQVAQRAGVGIDTIRFYALRVEGPTSCEQVKEATLVKPAKRCTGESWEIAVCSVPMPIGLASPKRPPC